MNKLYSVHDHWTDINKKNDVDIESINGVITGIKVNGEDYGGGESDFSTAEVTLVGKDGSVAGDVYLSTAAEESPAASVPRVNFIANESHTYNAILYKGSAAALVANPAHTIESITGDAQKLSPGAILITGDCTITIS